MNPFLVALLLGVLLVVLAKLIFDRTELARPIVWLLALIPYGVVHLASIDLAPFCRMVLLCSVLMAGMKWVVYSEWRKSGGTILRWQRWFCFGFLWFGMEPMAWVCKSRALEWKRDAYWGLGCCVVGVLALVLMAGIHVSAVIPLFIAMSLGFHYGALRLLTAFWRLQGRPVRALFRNPLVMQGFADFWGNRWNLAYSQMMARAVKRPLQRRFGGRVALFGVFIISGVLHELAITVPVQAGYGLPTCFFLLQGTLTVFEKRGGIWQGILCGASLLVTFPLLFPTAFVEAVIIPVRDVLNFTQL